MWSDLIDRLARTSFRYATEDDLQRGIAQLLTSRELSFRREVVLGPRDRIDFLLEDGLGIEVKIDGSQAALARQVLRYLQYPTIQGILVVTTRSKHAAIPESLSGKPIHVVHLIGSLI